MQKDSVTPTVATWSDLDIATMPTITPTIAIELETYVFNIIDLVIRNPPIKIQKNHPTKNIIGDLTKGIRARDGPSLNYQDMGYKKGEVDKTLFIKSFKTSIVIVQIYVDDIVFGSIALSIMEAEYIAAKSHYTQLLWMNQMLEDSAMVKIF